MNDTPPTSPTASDQVVFAIFTIDTDAPSALAKEGPIIVKGISDDDCIQKCHTYLKGKFPTMFSDDWTDFKYDVEYCVSTITMWTSPVIQTVGCQLI